MLKCLAQIVLACILFSLCGECLALARQTLPMGKCAFEADAPSELDDEIESNGYKYSIKAELKSREYYDHAPYYDGYLTVSRLKDNKIIHSEYVEIEASCYNFPLLSLLPYRIKGLEEDQNLVAYCASYDLKHSFMKLFNRDIPLFNLNVATFDFGENADNITRIGDSMFVAKSSFRALYSGKSYGGPDRVQLYSVLNLKHQDIFPVASFVRTFGGVVARYYLKDYRELKDKLFRNISTSKINNKLMFNQVSVALLSSLVGTQNNAVICSEIKLLHKLSVTDAEIQVRLDMVKEIGLPGFNIQTCKEKL